jgi:dihydroxy-acid dehydratase
MAEAPRLRSGDRFDDPERIDMTAGDQIRPNLGRGQYDLLVPEKLARRMSKPTPPVQPSQTPRQVLCRSTAGYLSGTAVIEESVASRNVTGKTPLYSP